METLVIIPSLMHKYSFSAPLAWLFAHDIDRVRGIYSAHLNKVWVQKYDQFIVELNWFIELYEFGLIVRFIKTHNPNARILFGGLYSQLKYKKIFKEHPVDYFIKGDAEIPIREYLNGTRPEEIPNMIGRHFENRHTYHFSADQFENLEFSLDWIPEYEEGWMSFPEPGNFEDMSFEHLPKYPQYWENPKKKLPLSLRWRVAPRGGRYHLPMLFTGRGGCPAAHSGCDYCMGSKHHVMQSIYDRPPVIMTNDHLIHLLEKIEKKFMRMSLYVNTNCQYDLSGYQFDLDATVEIDCASTAREAERLTSGFKKANVHVALFEEGITGKKARASVDDYLALEDENHRLHFFATSDDIKRLNIPEESRLYTEFVFPFWTDWNYYNDDRKAFTKSRQWYQVTGQTNLYPKPKQLISRIVRPIAINTLWIMQRAGILDIKKLIL